MFFETKATPIITVQSGTESLPMLTLMLVKLCVEKSQLDSPNEKLIRH